MPGAGPRSEARAALPAVLHPLFDQAARGALFLDFDGTLAPIVADPAAAAPVPGTARVLARLARRLALVAVVSGRPASFLGRALGPVAGVRMAGLYGMEVVQADGTVATAPEAAPWRPVIAALVAEARREAPPGVGVEDKGLTVTLHWRGLPAGEAWVRRFAESAARRTGVQAQPGRRSIELRPAVPADKGTVVRRWATGYLAVACFGDDLGDLPAFRALGELAAAGVPVVRVAVVDPESPPEVARAADLVVEGPAGALSVLELLAG